MKKTNSKKIRVSVCLSAILILLSFLNAPAQKNASGNNPAAAASPLLKRTAYKTETVDFGAGGTVSIVGAPNGSITVEGWAKNSVEISADVEVQAGTESDLALLAQVNTFVVDADFGHIRVQTLGAYDKNYMKRVAKKFPKHLLDMPFRVDYRIKVPLYCDLEIDGGRGDLNLSNVEGVIQINLLESNAKLNLVGGTIVAVIGSGDVDVTIPKSSWRGRNIDVQMARGNLSVLFPPNLNANVNASILRTGQIENAYDFLKPRESRTKFTDKSIAAKSGGGGAQMNFTVGDGILKLVGREK